uniref:RAB3GAP2_N domain-containing protein n=2 Tax=Bursaphelenchus xylophilus TaxID=6326 RepID=A0A1I7S808_BURXY
MSCALKNFFRFSSEQINQIDKFLDEDPPVSSAKGSPSNRKGKPSSLLTPDDEDLLENNSEGEDIDDNGDKWPNWEPDSSEFSENDAKLSSVESKWLRNCMIASSANLEVIVIGAVQRFVVLERSEKDEKLRVLSWVRMNMQAHKDAFITAIEVISLASTRKTEASTVDWHCLAVACSSGYVHFYTDRGVEILYEKFSAYPIRELRFGPSVYEGQQGLSAMSMGRVYIVEGMSLFHGLRHARNEIARGEKTFEEICNSYSFISHAVQLDYLKQPSYFQLLNVSRPEDFDRYFGASLSDYGEKARLTKSGASNYMNLFCATNSSYAAFLSHDKETEGTNILHEAYHTIAAQMPSFGFRSLLGIGVSKKDGPQKDSVADAKLGNADVLARLVDPGRKCEATVVAPRNWNLMAISDGTARVLLLDTKYRTVVRIWKGYRNARCGFIESASSDLGINKRNRTKTLFLVIFAPKRGLLEIWSMQNGPRVAAFNVDPKGRLLSIPSSRDSTLMGPSEKQLSGPYNDVTVVFLSSNGTAQRIQVPFYLSAMDSTVSQMHDDNLLKDFSHCELNENGKLHVEKALETVKSLKSTQSRIKFVDKLIENSEAWKVSTDQLLDFLSGIKEFDHGLKAYSEALIRLLDVYFISVRTPVEERPSGASYDTLVQDLGISVDEYNEFSLDIILDTQRKQDPFEKCTFSEFRQMFRLNNMVEAKWLVTAEADEKFLARILLQKVLFLRKDDVIGSIQTISEKLNLDLKLLANLFISVWLSEWNINPWVLLDNANVVMSYFKDHLHDVKINHLAESYAIKSENPEASLSLMLVTRFVDGMVRLMSDESVEFENMDETTNSWYLMTKNLVANTLLSRLDEELRPSLEKLTSKGFGYYREQIGQWAASNNIPVDLLVRALRENKKIKIGGEDEKDGENKVEEEMEKEEDEQMEEEYAKDFKILKRLQEIFPESFNRDLCLCDCVWESASTWFKDENNRKINSLSQSMSYLSAISSSPRLRHGLAFILWDTFIRSPFQKLTQMIVESHGKPLKERLLKRDVFVTESELLEFVKAIRNLLNVLQKSVVDLDYAPHLQLQYEEFLEDYLESFKIKKNRKHTLAELVSGQTPVNYHLVLHHLHLAIIIELQIALGLPVRLEQVFDGIMHRAFFEPLHSHPLIPMSDTDDRNKERRQKFLEEIVTAIGVETSQEYYEKWELINQLAKEWSLDQDLLRIKEVKMFYEYGFDREAEKLKASVGKQKQLAFEMIPLALGRFKALLDSNDELKQKAQRKLRPGSWEYLRVLSDQFLPTFEVSVDKTHSLMRTVSNLLNYNLSGSQNKNVMEKKMISDICDFLQSLK